MSLHLYVLLESVLSIASPLTLGVVGIVTFIAALTLGKLYFNGGYVPSNLLNHTNLNGKVAIVTGPSLGGIGFEAAAYLYSRGATVILGVRNVSNGDIVQQEILKKYPKRNASTLKVIALDLSDLQSVKSFVKTFKEQYDRVDLLLNNAGIMMTPYSTTKQGVEIQFGTNHLGHFLLTYLLLNDIKQSNGRVINVSSRAGEHWVKGREETQVVVDQSRHALRGFSSFTLNTVQGDGKEIPSDRLYGRSKFANMVFTKRLEKELRKDPNTFASAFSLHPGVVRTQLWRNLNPLYFLLVAPFWWFVTKDAWQGAQTSIYLCVAPKDQLKGGCYYADCKLDESENKLAFDEELQERLWTTSLQLCQPFI
ncbi:hypothetical protein C9374_013360 [Naegleria lovaniensis]|uniref:Uncharacterized protein n=1 Tax=Naegleria lovaniensis TaxID=51637 RepID=A0AA88GZ44_NAELO|nr:uncharacterized protein C9374_013360 [Naegleria lovaniensis]KAG2391875.1 hypothetical protein C9374_013360 [Naegleria lovaniensis]